MQSYFRDSALEAQYGVNDWYIGVRSTNKELIVELQKELQKFLGKSRSDKEWQWPWWKFVDDKYRNWDVLIPALDRECNGKGEEVKNYFVKEFATIAKVAIPIIDRYEGT